MSRLRDHILSAPPHTPPYVLEDMAKIRPRPLITLLGINWMATPTAWVAPIWITAVGVIISFATRPETGVGQKLLIGLAYGLLIGASIVLHQLGGALCGRAVAAPMRLVVFTATLGYNNYDESREYPSHVHLIRGLGEPGANLLLGATMLALYFAGLDSHFVVFLAILNLAFFTVAMSPLPTMHGGVVLRHLREWEKGSRKSEDG